MLLNLDDERLTPRRKNRIQNIVASWAVDGLPLTDLDIDRMVRVAVGVTTEDEAIAEIDALAYQWKAEQQGS